MFWCSGTVCQDCLSYHLICEKKEDFPTSVYPFSNHLFFSLFKSIGMTLSALIRHSINNHIIIFFFGQIHSVSQEKYFLKATDYHLMSSFYDNWIKNIWLSAWPRQKQKWKRKLFYTKGSTFSYKLSWPCLIKSPIIAFVLLRLKINFAFQDSDHSFKGRRFLPQDTRKFGCPAKIFMSEVIRFPGYQVNHKDKKVKQNVKE